MRARNRLTAVKVKAHNTPGRYADGGGLWLQVSEWKTKSWLFRYQLNGKARAMGLGPVDAVSLARAREKAQAAREMLADGLDPLEAKAERKQAARLAVAKRVTFKEAAERYIAGKSPEWKNEKHQWQWKATLETHAYPVFGDVNVADVDTGLVLKVLEPVWLKMPETASRLRGRIEAVLGWATVHGYRTGDNPARLRGHLGEVLPKKSKIRPVQHQPALPYQETAAFMAELRSKAGIGARALEFTILTAARTGEVIGATWAEIDIETKVWTVPADRMKMGKAHSVPLSDRAVEILKALPREHGNDHVFIGGRKGAGLSNMAMLKLMKGMRPGLTVHGFRSTFRDWAGECTNFPREIAEAALAHTLSSDTEAAYRRGTALEKRRKMMTAWAGYCSRPVAVGGDVIPINKAASA